MEILEAVSLKLLVCKSESELYINGLAQLARALDLHSRGHRFDSDILHR